MMERIFLLVFFFFFFNVFGQEATLQPPPVTIEDLTESAHPIDNGASAAYKYRYGKTWFELVNGGRYWVMVTEVYTRLKVYKQSGFEYANAEITYYSDTWRAKGFFSEAVTYNLVNGAIEKTVLKKDSEFEEEMGNDFIRKKIIMPNVREGSIVEYKYTLKTPYLSAINDWYFQFPIPADDVRYDLHIPISFNYKSYYTGFVSITKSPTITTYSNEKTGVDERFYSYSAKNVKAIKNEQYVNNIDNYTAVLKHELRRMSMSWESLALAISKSERFGGQLSQSSYYKADIDLKLKGVIGVKSRADSIFAFIRDRMTWNKYSGCIPQKGVSKAYAEKTGNVADINLILISMLRYIGLEANPVLLSTRSHGVPLFATPYAYDYVIASVVIEGNLVLMDATSKYAVPDILPQRVLNGNGRLVRKDGTNIEFDLMPEIKSRQVVNIMAKIDEDGKVTGKSYTLYSDFISHDLRELFAMVQKEDYIQKKESAYKGIEISNYKLLNDKNPSKPLTEEYDFTDRMIADVINGKIYFSPMLFFALDENPFTTETREYPIDFSYPQQRRYIINITLPDGYTVESSPRSINTAIVDQIGSFKYNVTTTGNVMQLSVFFDINSSVVSQEYYPVLKDFFKKMIDKQNEKVVLTKTSK